MQKQSIARKAGGNMQSNIRDELLLKAQGKINRLAAQLEVAKAEYKAIEKRTAQAALFLSKK